MDYLSRLYEREIKDFFEVAKIKMTGTTKEGKKFGKLLGGIYVFLIFLLFTSKILIVTSWGNFIMVYNCSLFAR